MKEIHAYQNDDGTYRVEIIGTTHQTKTVGKHEIKEMIEAKTEIPRALLHIEALTSNDEGQLVTIMIGD